MCEWVCPGDPLSLSFVLPLPLPPSSHLVRPGRLGQADDARLLAELPAPHAQQEAHDVRLLLLGQGGQVLMLFFLGVGCVREGGGEKVREESAAAPDVRGEKARHQTKSTEGEGTGPLARAVHAGTPCPFPTVRPREEGVRWRGGRTPTPLAARSGRRRRRRGRTDRPAPGGTPVPNPLHGLSLARGRSQTSTQPRPARPGTGVSGAFSAGGANGCSTPPRRSPDGQEAHAHKTPRAVQAQTTRLASKRVRVRA